MKIRFYNTLAAKISNETMVTHDGKSVLNIIQHIEQRFQDVHNFAQ